MTTIKRLICGAMVLIVAGLSGGPGCSHGQKAAIHLDKVAANIDKFGFASISAPFLAAPSDEFAFDLDKPADYYFDRAFQPQGGVRNFSAEALDMQTSIRVNIEQALATIAQYQRARTIAEMRDAKRKAGVQKQLLETLVGSGGEEEGASPAIPGLKDNPLVASTIGMLDVVANQEEPDTEPLPGFVPTTQPIDPAPPFDVADRIALGAVGTTFTPGLAMPAGPFQISAREAMMIASGDVISQSLLRWFMDPTGNKLRHYELYFCPVVVSVQPGYETRAGHLADITVSVDLARPTTGGLDYLSSEFEPTSPPLQVAGIFPVLDAQVLDMVNSRRSLYATAFQLAMAGFGTQADFFLDYARRLEQDVQTQTALTAASAYTIGSTAFGFRVEPKVVAVTEVGELESAPGRRLESKSFPALAVLLVHRSYLRSKEQVETNSGHAWHKNKQLERTTDVSATADADKGKFDFLSFRTSVRWSPVNRPGWFQERYSEVNVWKSAEQIDAAFEDLGSFDRANEAKPEASKYQRWNLKSRTNTLVKLAMDSEALVRVYHTEPADKVIVHEIWPKRGWIDQTTTVTIRGKGFRSNVKSVTVGGIRCPHKILDDGLLVVEVKPWGKPSDTVAKSAAEFAELARAGETEGEQDPPGAESMRLTTIERVANELIQAKTEDEKLEAAGKLLTLVPVLPLTPEEKKILAGLTNLVATCQLGEDSDLAGNWSLYEDLIKRTRVQAAQEQSKKQADAGKADNAKKQQALAIGWAEVLIGSSKPVVHEATGSKAQAVGGAPGNAQTATGSVPGKEPSPSDFPDLKLKPDGYSVGWILFEKSLPAKAAEAKPAEAKSSPGSFSIQRDGEGRITGVTAGDGGVGNAMPLLQLIHESLGCEDDCGHFSMEITGPAIDMSASGIGKQPPPAATPRQGT
jgi:hypothetical protein